MPEESENTKLRVFWCNTNRGGGAGANSLEQRMYARSFAAAWSFADHPAGTFNYTDHMRRIRRGDMIIMYAMRVGVITVGQVKESRLEVLLENHLDRLRDYATEGENVEEWRVPVQWLAWNEGNPCVVNPLSGTFIEITDHADRVNAVFQHFAIERTPNPA
jgi:hypothetical protein